MGYSPPASSIHGILQVRILELPFSSPEDLPDSEIEPVSLMSPVSTGGFSGEENGNSSILTWRIPWIEEAGGL